MPAPQSEIDKAKAFWASLLPHAKEHEEKTGIRPTFRMNPATMDLITTGRIITAGSLLQPFLEIDGYRITVDPQVPVGKIHFQGKVVTPDQANS